MARACELPMHEYYPVPQNNNRLDLSLLLQEVLNDIDNHAGQEFIAKKFFYSLARLIGQVRIIMRLMRLLLVVAYSRMLY